MNKKDRDLLPHFRPSFEENFMDGRHRSIGDLRAQYNCISWSPANSKVWYSLPIEEFSELIEKHCANTENQSERKDFFQEYAPLHYSNNFHPKDFTAEQFDRLRNLNERLTKIEHQTMDEVMPQLMLLDARVKDPDDWLQDYECDCNFTFYIGKDDPDYNEENSENVLIKLSEYLKFYPDEEKHFGLADGENHNEFQYWQDHPMYGDFHCWLFHCLYDHTKIGWINILRIEDVCIDIQIEQQH